MRLPEHRREEERSHREDDEQEQEEEDDQESHYGPPESGRPPHGSSPGTLVLFLSKAFRARFCPSHLALSVSDFSSRRP